MTDKATDGLSVSSYLHVLARWKWVIIVVALVLTVAGAAYTWTRTPMYSASAQLLYVKQIDISSPLTQSYTDTTAQRAEIESVPTVIQSNQVRTAAEMQMKASSVAAGYSVTAVLQLGADGSSYSNVVTIEAASADPEAAADAANAYSAAFIEWGRDSARSQVADAIAVVQSRMDSYTSSASTDTSEYAALKTSLEQLQLLEASASGSFKVITAASPPSAPFSPDTKRGVVLALVAGLVLGIALAFLLEQFDTRLHGDDQISELLELPIIGHVPSIGVTGREADVLPTLTDPTGRTAEAYRLLRSNLEFVGFDSDMRVLLVSSSLQGEGKSVTVCNLAVALALAGKKVVLIDADLRSPRVHAYLGVPNAAGVSTVLARRIAVDDALSIVALESRSRQNGALIITTQVSDSAGRPLVSRAKGPAPAEVFADAAWPDEPGGAPLLRVLTSGPLPPNPGEMVASPRFGEIVEHVRGEADVVLIDAPAMLPVGDTAALARIVDGLVYVVNPARVRRPVLQQARSQLRHLPCSLLGVIEVAERKGQGQYSGYYSHADEGGTAPRRRG